MKIFYLLSVLSTLKTLVMLTTTITYSIASQKIYIRKSVLNQFNTVYVSNVTNTDNASVCKNRFFKLYYLSDIQIQISGTSLLERV